MADRIAENADLVVDELKRKARRRLVGAIVLALAGAVILPMLLEKDPRPLGDDVSVQIPPVDEGRFVNRLTGRSGDAKPLPKADGRADSKAALPKSETVADIAPPAAKALPATPAQPTLASVEPPASKGTAADAEQRILSPPAKVAAKAEAKPVAGEAKPAPKAVATGPKPAPGTAAVEAKPEPKPEAADAKSGAKPAATEAKPEAKGVAPEATPAAAGAQPAGTPGAAPAQADGFVVQLAAFADDKGANALANKLKKMGYAAFVEPVQTSRGTLWRVRVGGYASRPEADAARVRLKGEGFSGIVAPAK